jgi:hypothetical protein
MLDVTEDKNVHIAIRDVVIINGLQHPAYIDKD